MSDSDPDDYLSDKFLTKATDPSVYAAKTYSQLRKEAARNSKFKNEQNRIKSRRERELQSRAEGLSKSLFERAEEEKEAGISSGRNKALSMMMKMGFKPGQSLGKTVDEVPISDGAHPDRMTGSDGDASEASLTSSAALSRGQIVEPIPLNEWAGKKGIGLGKRARSLVVAEERVAKMAREAEEISHTHFRGRASREYDERRAEGKLRPAQSTCASLDEKAGKPFQVFWLNPDVPDTFPSGLLEELVLRGYARPSPEYQREPVNLRLRLRRQMQADSLRPLKDDESDKPLLKSKELSAIDTFPSEIVDEALRFLHLPASSRLELVLSYLRDNYAYCFWCGVEYEDQETMDKECPGPDEELHD